MVVEENKIREDPLKKVQEAPNLLAAKVEGVVARSRLRTEGKTLEEKIKFNETVARGIESETKVYEAKEKKEIISDPTLKGKRRKVYESGLDVELCPERSGDREDQKSQS